MKTPEQLQKMLDEIEEDERLYYQTATVFENAPLALIQTQLEVQSATLRDVLELPKRSFLVERKKKGRKP